MNERIEARPVAAEDRSKQLQELFRRNFASVSDATYSHLNVTQAEYAEHLPAATLALLDTYTGPIEDAPFQNWIVQTVVPAADRIARFLAFKEQNEPLVRAAIWSVLKGCMDLGVGLGNIDGNRMTSTVDEIAAPVWFPWAWDNFESLTASCRLAKPTTRLYEQAYWAARAWKTERLRHKYRYISDAEQVDRITSVTGRTPIRTGHMPEQEPTAVAVPEGSRRKASDVTKTRRCLECDTVLGRWNTKSAICFACWEAGQQAS